MTETRTSSDEVEHTVIVQLQIGLVAGVQGLVLSVHAG